MDSKVCLADQDDERMVEGFSWDNFCPDQEFMTKEKSKEMSNVKAFIANAYDEYWAAIYRKIREAEEEKWRKIEEEEEERLKAEAEKKKRAEFFQTRRTVKDVPKFEIKVDAEAIKVPKKCMNCDSLIKQNIELLHNIKRLKESYDTMNREINKIYPIVEKLKTFEKEKTLEEKKSVTKDEDEVDISGTSAEKEQKSSFWKETNKEFLAKKQEEIKKSFAQKKTEMTTCFQCKTVGHITRNCPKAIQTKQGVSGFENSTFETGECLKNVVKRKENLKNQKWVVKGSGNSYGDDSDFTKSEEPRVVEKVEK
ncbi:uncharacterized protein LOC110943697 [Helianthus annuus]|uniref:uncharacterized protein LOC110943697 n=1 Tax=Helianthus annuus TaxID=4232 RepID=UPI000B8F58C9|nr:uncharacterized protein LOC110943697 [Helianthus annuus]